VRILKIFWRILKKFVKKLPPKKNPSCSTDATDLYIFKGFDCSPMLYTINNGTPSFVSKLDVPPENKNANTIFQKFRNVDRNALETLSDLQLKSLHQNAIVYEICYILNFWAQNWLQKSIFRQKLGPKIDFDLKMGLNRFLGVKIGSKNRFLNSNLSSKIDFCFILKSSKINLYQIQFFTLHSFSQLLPHTGNTQNIVKFTTCGSDGLVALWDLKVSHKKFFCKNLKNQNLGNT
jgi:hypothetical protein